MKTVSAIEDVIVDPATRWRCQRGEMRAEWKNIAPSTGLCQLPSWAISAIARARCQPAEAWLITGIVPPWMKENCEGW
jgi:hypothetical protein